MLAGGVQIENNTSGNFTAFIKALDSANHVVFSSSLNGVSIGGSDNSAIFIGVTSTGPAFAKLRFSTSDSATYGIGANDFAINRASLRIGNFAAPEPASLAFLGLAIPMIGFVRRKV